MYLYFVKNTMKAKITQKDAKRLHSYSFWYCEIQYLLRYETPVFYTCNMYGRRADFYRIENPKDNNDYIWISTGYWPTGDRHVPYKIYKKYEQKAKNHEYKNPTESRRFNRILIFKMIREWENEKTK